MRCPGLRSDCPPLRFVVVLLLLLLLPPPAGVRTPFEVGVAVAAAVMAASLLVTASVPLFPVSRLSASFGTTVLLAADPVEARWLSTTGRWFGTSFVTTLADADVDIEEERSLLAAVGLAVPLVTVAGELTARDRVLPAFACANGTPPPPPLLATVECREALPVLL